MLFFLFLCFAFFVFEGEKLFLLLLFFIFLTSCPLVGFMRWGSYIRVQCTVDQWPRSAGQEGKVYHHITVKTRQNDQCIHFSIYLWFKETYT